MIGYHYTTREAWESIQYTGLDPSPIQEGEYHRLLRCCTALPRDVIWVWKEELTDEQALIISLVLAAAHASFDVVLLKVDYEPASSASIACKENPDDTIKFKCGFSVGPLYTGELPFDLILDRVSPSNITELWSMDLLTSFHVRHAREQQEEMVAA